MFNIPEGRMKNPKFLEQVSSVCSKDDHLVLIKMAHTPKCCSTSISRIQISIVMRYGQRGEKARLRKQRGVPQLSKSCDDTFSQLIQVGVSPNDLYNAVCQQEVEIFLTAHPTQINRRTLQYIQAHLNFLKAMKSPWLTLVDVHLDDESYARAAVPSGASTGPFLSTTSQFELLLGTLSGNIIEVCMIIVRNDSFPFDLILILGCLGKVVGMYV